MKKLLPLCLPLGLFTFLIYQVMKRFFEIPDIVAIPYSIVSCILMLIGVAYTSWCRAKHKNPYDFK